MYGSRNPVVSFRLNAVVLYRLSSLVFLSHTPGYHQSQATHGIMSCRRRTPHSTIHMTDVHLCFAFGNLASARCSASEATVPLF